ncbi:MAG: SDR family NAD(P)-dependent oxidoreductase, partial [Caulobacterales bacterium]
MNTQNRWSDAEADAFIDRYAQRGFNTDMALRVYTSRLLGADTRLVQHGGGNTSVKTVQPDLLGAETAVLCVKGSGWDLQAIEPAGLPALRMQSLLSLRGLRQMRDEDMVNAQRCALLDSTAPTPSVETLLHAWIPEKFIDHTHANAILALTDQPQGADLCRELFGARVAVAPYCMPGFALAHQAADTYAMHPGTEGLVLLKHGLFTWGATAQEAYERMIALVQLAEDRLRAADKKSSRGRPRGQKLAAAGVAPVVRGALMRASGLKWSLAARTNGVVRAYVDHPQLARFSQVGVATPDHVIRTKPWPMILDLADVAPHTWREAADAALVAYTERYRAYFDQGAAAATEKKVALDPFPRVVLAPGLGVFGVGASAKDAAIAADIAETTIEVVSAAERMDRFESISALDIFEMEYWSLEQAKLGKAAPKPLAGAVVAVTGGAGAIGAAIARAFAASGAEVAVLDLDLAGADAVAKSVKGFAVACDVTDPASVHQAFAA